MKGLKSAILVGLGSLMILASSWIAAILGGASKATHIEVMGGLVILSGVFLRIAQFSWAILKKIKTK